MSHKTSVDGTFRKSEVFKKVHVEFILYSIVFNHGIKKSSLGCSFLVFLHLLQLHCLLLGLVIDW